MLGDICYNNISDSHLLSCLVSGLVKTLFHMLQSAIISFKFKSFICWQLLISLCLQSTISNYLSKKNEEICKFNFGVLFCIIYS